MPETLTSSYMSVILFIGNMNKPCPLAGPSKKGNPTMASIVTRKSIEVQIKEACERARKNPDLYIIAIGDTGCGWNAIVNSASTPFQEYTIVRDVDGNLHCSCPAQDRTAANSLRTLWHAAGRPPGQDDGRWAR